MSKQTEAQRLAAWLNEGAWHQMRLVDVEAAGRELRRLDGVEADYARLMEKHNALHMNAARHRLLNAQLLKALEAARDVMLSRGVTMTPEHPDRLALNLADAAIEAAKEQATPADTKGGAS